jgi:hypothetical protein
MAKPVYETKIREAEWQKVRQALGRGALNLGYAVLADAQAEAPVRGAYRSTTVGGPIGGTLRRSLHAAAWVDGQPVPGSASADENGKAIPSDYDIPTGIVVIVGTNSDYGWYVEGGTSRMGARPFLTPAWDANLPEAGSLIAAGSGL